MAVTEQLEEAAADRRSRNRQSKTVPFLIRDDGVLMPNVPLIARKKNFRPYHGDPAASLQERMEFLQGLSAKRRVINSAEQADEEAPFDIAKASKDELITFAEENYAVTLDPAMHLNKMRAEVARMAGLTKTPAPKQSVPAEL